MVCCRWGGRTYCWKFYQDGVLALFGLFCSTQGGPGGGDGISHDKNKMADEKAKSLLLGDWDQKFIFQSVENAPKYKPGIMGYACRLTLVTSRLPQCTSLLYCYTCAGFKSLWWHRSMWRRPQALAATGITSQVHQPGTRLPQVPPYYRINLRSWSLPKPLRSWVVSQSP